MASSIRGKPLHFAINTKARLKRICIDPLSWGFGAATLSNGVRSIIQSVKIVVNNTKLLGDVFGHQKKGAAAAALQANTECHPLEISVETQEEVPAERAHREGELGQKRVLITDIVHATKDSIALVQIDAE